MIGTELRAASWSIVSVSVVRSAAIFSCGIMPGVICTLSRKLGGMAVVIAASVNWSTAAWRLACPDLVASSANDKLPVPSITWPAVGLTPASSSVLAACKRPGSTLPPDRAFSTISTALPPTISPATCAGVSRTVPSKASLPPSLKTVGAITCCPNFLSPPAPPEAANSPAVFR